jgi:hypothetical protein
LFAVAVSVAVSLSPGVVVAYCTVTEHVFCGPRLVPLHVSLKMVNALSPLSAIRKTLVPE